MCVCKKKFTGTSLVSQNHRLGVLIYRCAVQNVPAQYRCSVGHPHTPSVRPAFCVWSGTKQERRQRGQASCAGAVELPLQPVVLDHPHSGQAHERCGASKSVKSVAERRRSWNSRSRGRGRCKYEGLRKTGERRGKRGGSSLDEPPRNSSSHTLTHRPPHTHKQTCPRQGVLALRGVPRRGWQSCSVPQQCCPSVPLVGLLGV